MGTTRVKSWDRSTLFVLMVAITLFLSIAFTIFLISIYYRYQNLLAGYTGFCLSHGYSKAIIQWDRNYCYRIENGTEIIVPIEEVE